MAKQLESLLGWPITYDDGTWYVNGKKLYDQFPIYHDGGIAGDDPTLKQKELIAKLEKGEAIIPEKQQESLFEILDFEESMMGKYGKLFAAMGNTDLMTPMMQEQIKQDAQQAQSVVTHGGDNYNIDVPVQIYPLQKLTEQEVKKLARIIGKNTIDNLNSATFVPGTPVKHFGHWKTIGLEKFNSDL